MPVIRFPLLQKHSNLRDGLSQAVSLSDMIKTSNWAAFQNPAFRRLWVASVISGTWVAAHETAATWMMNILTASPIFLSLMSTLASMPYFLLTLPAGAVSDIMDRRKLLCLTNLWLLMLAACVAVLGWLRLLDPYILLACVFLTGAGFAFNAPAWSSIVPQVVSDAELPSAVILGGLQMNISGIVGPALGGVLVPLIGPNYVFVVNAGCFLVVIYALLRWENTRVQSGVPLESFCGSFVTAIRYARYATGLQTVLARNALFALCISIIPALMPVVSLRVLYLSPSCLGLLLTTMSAGSVIGAVVVLPWLRARYRPNTVTGIANVLLLLVFVSMAGIHKTETFFLFAVLAGIGWTLSASELWLAAQRVTPGWARGRMNAAFIMVSQGAIAFGGVIWAYTATTAGVNYAFIEAAILLLISLVLSFPLSINFTEAMSSGTGRRNSHKRVCALPGQDGPVHITVEFKIDSTRRHEFVSLMREVRLIHLRNGAQGWGLHEDLTCSNTFRLEMVVPSWNDHVAQCERLTKAEEDFLKKAWSLHMGASPPEQRSYVSMKKELHTR
jgi:MFS family permease